MEAITALQPDLILNGYNQDTDRNAAFFEDCAYNSVQLGITIYGTCTNLATFLANRMRQSNGSADLIQKAEAMWGKLNLAEGETATIFLQLGKLLYVMGNRSLGVVLYQEHGFAIPPAIQQNIIDKDLTFVELSEELMPDYAGDHLFVLTLDTDESRAESDRLLQSTLWKTLPTVQQGHVYTASAEWNTDNLLALEQLLDELPKWMNQ
ncbi:ABC transporter substrate-binding protein [Paenibacillus amylolyticus]|nr:ABC transporter substrate-binding protein [Paenibacillus amylolyticus]